MKKKPVSVFSVCIIVLIFWNSSFAQERWQLILSDQAAQTSWYVDTKILFQLPGNRIRVWVREVYPGFTYEAMKEIDCPEFYVRYIGCTRYGSGGTAQGPCFDDASYESWMYIEPGSLEDDLHAALCKPETEQGELPDNPAGSFNEPEQPYAGQPVDSYR